MKIIKENRSHRNKIYALGGLLLFVLTANAVENNSTKSTQDEVSSNLPKTPWTGTEQTVKTSETYAEQPLTLKTDPLTGQVHFNTKTVDISVLNRQKDKENAEKVAIIQKDLQSRIKLTDREKETPQTERYNVSTEDPEEILRKQVKVKEDIESRVVLDSDDKRYRVDSEEFYEDYKHPIKRADVEYYEDEPMVPEERPVSLAQRMTTEAPKEEDSFFSIFESLFGTNDDESQNKKSKVEEKPSEDGNLKEHIKAVGDILKPIRPQEDAPVKSSYAEYDDPPEYRIINEHPQKQGFRPSEQRPYQYSYQRPSTIKPYQPYRPYPTPGYEDYDLEEFIDKSDDKLTTEKLTTPKVTSVSTTTTTTTTTTKTFFNTNRPKVPVAEKKSDYVGKTSQVSNVEKVTEKGTYFTVKPSAEKEHPKRQQEYETKVNEVKPEKIQDSANFYNLINLPVRYSTKDTAIPLISTSYANTKIQGMGAHKYDKTNNGKYPNHKYDTVSNVRSTSTTRRPSYWSARRTTTQATVTTPSPAPTVRSTSSTTYKPPERQDFVGVDYDDLAIGSSANFGGYGNKAGATKIKETRVPYNNVKETTTRRVYETQKNKDAIQEGVNSYKVQPVRESTTVRTTVRTTPKRTTEATTAKPAKEIYDDEYEYDSFPAVVQEVKPPKESSIKLHSSYSEKNRVYESQSDSAYKRTPSKTTTSTTESVKEELPEYEYYEYETDITAAPSSTTTTTTPKYRVKYPSLQKDKIRTTTEKVAVVVPSNNQDYFVDDEKDTTSTTVAATSPKLVPTRTTSTTTSSRDPILSQESNNFKGSYSTFYRPKEPAPVFEESDESDEYTPRPISIHITKRTTTERPTTQVKPIIVTATKKDHENNVNIVLVPMKEPQKETQRPEETTKPRTEQPSTVSVHKTYTRPNDVYNPNFDYTTEFTVGAVHGHSGSVPVQGHFVASSISTNPYGDDEPFRPIPKPPGLSTSFQVIADEDDPRKPMLEIQTAHSEKRPPPHLNFEEGEPIHEPHEFIPSPKFDRPGDTKISNTVKTGASEISVDYDFDGIQTEPKPGQYVIFSKPQLNPEMNEGQLKNKPEVVTSSKAPTVPHYHETVNNFGGESHKHFLHSTKPGQFYTSVPELKPSTSEKPDLRRPNYPIAPELLDERLSLQLVPPKSLQTEKPFEGNFVTPEYEKAEVAANYPRPHWEKNGKPAFLLNSLANKNEIGGNRPVPIPPQMAPTLIPPSSAIPQRFRKPPLPHHMPPIRKNFNEGTINSKPKPNLPNILPQFRPNAKIGTGPYQRPFHRPQGYMNSNRRNGPSRYHEKEGNFPYHIHHPAEKDSLMHRDFEVEPEFYPKFITNRGKIPSELLEPHAMHKRYGGGPPNVPTRRVYQQGPDNPTFLRRLQRTPVTTLQMLQQTPGVRTRKNPVLREDGEDPSVPMVPPVYQPYKDPPATEKNVHVVYPSNIHKSRHPVTNEREKFDNFKYEYPKSEDQYPLLNPTRRTSQEKDKPEFPYGFVRPDDKLKLIRKYPEENGTAKKNVKVTTDEREIKPNLQDYMPTVTKRPTPSSEVKDEKIDMNLHMQSNNQWNKVNAPEEDLIIITQNPLESSKSTDSEARKPEHGSDLKRKTNEGSQIRINPPSEYHTSIKDENNSAFTLGAVMHTIPEGNKKGQVTSVSLGDDLTIRNLDVNQRISNGKIITVSMPLDVKEEPKEEKQNYNFQAPFQASSSIVPNGAEPTNQGWSIVKNEGETDEEGMHESEASEQRNSTKFNFENFKPELIGGFKPIYELPEDDPEAVTKKEETTDREEKR